MRLFCCFTKSSFVAGSSQDCQICTANDAGSVSDFAFCSVKVFHLLESAEQAEYMCLTHTTGCMRHRHNATGSQEYHSCGFANSTVTTQS